MSNEFYNPTGSPSTSSFGSSAIVRAEFVAVQAGFAKLPPLATHGSEFVTINAGATAMVSLTAAQARTALSLAIGTNVQAWDADLDAIAALASAADKLPYATGAQAWALTAFTAAGRALVGGANAAAQLTSLGVSAFVQTLVDDADAATARTTLGTANAIAVGRNISARTNAATPNTKIDVAADEILVEDATGAVMVLKSLAVTVDFGVVGAAGIDAGVQALSTWYYLWAIAKADGTKSAIGSLSATAPTMPSGYTFKALISAVRSGAGNTFIKYRQFGSTVYYEARQTVGSTLGTIAETALSTAVQIPPIALSALLHVHAILGTNAGAAQNRFDVYPVTGGNYCQCFTGSSFASSTVHNDAYTEIPNLSQSLFYANTSQSGSPTTANGDIYALGFRLPLGGQ